MTGLMYYAVSQFARRKTPTVTGIKAKVSSMMSSDKWFCLTIQLDDMIEKLYPINGNSALTQIYTHIESNIPADVKNTKQKKVAYSLYNNILKGRYKVAIGKAYTSIDWHLTTVKDIYDFIPIFQYNFTSDADTIENAMTTYKIGLYIIFLELCFFKTFTNIMAEFVSTNSSAPAWFDPGDKDIAVFKNISEALDTMMSSLLVSRVKPLGAKSIALSAKAGIININIDIGTGSEIVNSGLLNNVLKLYNTIIR